MNRTQLVSRVKDYMNRPNLSADALSAFIESVEGQLNRALLEHPRNLYRANLTQGAGNDILPLPVDMMTVLQLKQGDTIWAQYPPEKIEEAKSAGNAFIARGNCFQLFPAPAVDTVFSLDYFGTLKPLVNDLDTNWVSTYFSDVYLYGCLTEGAIYIKDDQRGQGWGQIFLQRIAELRDQGWMQNIATAPQFR